MWRTTLRLTGVLLAGITSATNADKPQNHPQAVAFTQVKLTDTFWAPRIEANRVVTIPHAIRMCEETGRIDNFAKAGKLMPGGFKGIYFDDSDVYKVIEGAAYSLSQHPDKELEAKLDSIIDKIAASQQPDGYLMTFFVLAEPQNRWTDLRVKHELYCAGHLFEAAVAYHQATGKRKFLDVACKLADHIDSIFGPAPKRTGWSGHPEIELALVKLWRATGQERYRKLVEFFLEVRGSTRQAEEAYAQAHVPIGEQSEIVGHAVRAMYLYSGVADVAALDGHPDYLQAMDRLWHNVTGRKMYVTGGIGASASNEGFTADYDLPNESAYAETCASIGMVLWNHRLNLLHSDGKYADIVERALYNGLLAGVSLSGDRFFYVNPLASRGEHHRQAWYGCACCPSNMARFLPSLSGYVYATAEAEVWVNLYVNSTAQFNVGTHKLKIDQETRFPWDGQVKLKIQPQQPADFGLHLRIPGWCREFKILVNGQPVAETQSVKGYASIQRTWKDGDVVELNMSMPIERVACNPRVAADAGRVALQRGPLIYCLEGADNPHPVRQMALPREAKLSDAFEPHLLNGVVTIAGEGWTMNGQKWPEDALYQPVGAPAKAAFKAIPYYAWDNRTPGQMTVWLPEALGLVETQPAP